MTKTSLVRATERVIGKSIYDGLAVTVDLLWGTVNFGIALGTNFSMFCILIGIGEGIIYSRDLLVHAGSIVAVFAEIFIFLLAIAVDIVDAVADAVLALTLGFVHIKTLPLYDPTKVFSGDWYHRLANVGTECVDYTKTVDVVGFFLGQFTKNNVCVFLRFVEPVPWLWKFFYGALDWVTIDPRPDHGNCEDSTTDWLCACLGLGYVIIYLLVPILLGFLVLQSYKPAIAKLLSWAWTLVHFAFHLIFLKLLRGAITGWRDVRCSWEEFICERHLNRHHGRRPRV